MADDATRTDGQLLMRTAGDLIAELLQKHGQFVPFAVALGQASGEVSIVHVEYTDVQYTPIEQLRSVVGSGVRAGRYRAVAVAEEIEIVEPQTGQQTRAARIEIEHRAVDPVTWYWPYENAGGVWQFGGASGEGYLEQGEVHFFPAVR